MTELEYLQIRNKGQENIFTLAYHYFYDGCQVKYKGIHPDDFVKIFYLKCQELNITPLVFLKHFIEYFDKKFTVFRYFNPKTMIKYAWTTNSLKLNSVTTINEVT